MKSDLNNDFQCYFNVSSKKNLSNEVIIKNDNKLLNIKRFLKKYDLLNNKNLIKRKDIYYFIFYLQKDKNITFSLNTKDFLLSNILKYKILLKLEKEIKKMDFEEEYLKQFNTSLTIFKTNNSININTDDDEVKIYAKLLWMKSRIVVLNNLNSGLCFVI